MRVQSTRIDLFVSGAPYHPEPTRDAGWQVASQGTFVQIHRVLREVTAYRFGALASRDVTDHAERQVHFPRGRGRDSGSNDIDEGPQFALMSSSMKASLACAPVVHQQVTRQCTRNRCGTCSGNN